jgi:hypothetical protein
MIDLLRLMLAFFASLCKSRVRLEAKNVVLRQQINALRRRMPKRPALTNVDRLLFVWLYRWFPSIVGALAIVRPQTVIRWHRAGFRAYWRWRSGKQVGKPKVSTELRTLIAEMSRANSPPDLEQCCPDRLDRPPDHRSLTLGSRRPSTSSATETPPMVKP